MARSPTVGSRPPVVELRLEREAKLAELLDRAAGRRLEASGVLAKDGFLYVVYNLPHIARAWTRVWSPVRRWKSSTPWTKDEDIAIRVQFRLFVIEVVLLVRP